MLPVRWVDYQLEYLAILVGHRPVSLTPPMASGLPPSAVLRLGLGIGLGLGLGLALRLGLALGLGLGLGLGLEMRLATTRVRSAAAVCAGDSVSLTLTATGKLPLVVGVPLTVSVPPLSVADNPSGSPVTVQL